MKTAVFLRGHARTWNFTKQNNLTLFEEIYGDVDWYVGFLNTGTVSDEQLKADFVNRHLISGLLLEPAAYPLPESHSAAVSWATFHSAYWRLAWIDYHLGKYKREFEHKRNIKYDNVLFIRPDVWYWEPAGIRQRLTMKLKMLSVCEIGSDGNMEDDWTVGDLTYRAGSAAADLLTLRYIDPHYTWGTHQLVHGSSHALLGQFTPRRSIGYDIEGVGIQTYIIRPDHIDNQFLDLNAIDLNHRDSTIWHTLPDSVKLEYCSRCGISPADYQLTT